MCFFTTCETLFIVVFVVLLPISRKAGVTISVPRFGYHHVISVNRTLIARQRPSNFLERSFNSFGVVSTSFNVCFCTNGMTSAACLSDTRQTPPPRLSPTPRGKEFLCPSSTGLRGAPFSSDCFCSLSNLAVLPETFAPQSSNRSEGWVRIPHQEGGPSIFPLVSW